MDEVMGGETRFGGNGSATEATNRAMKQATDAIDRLRGVVDQATTTFRDFSQVSGEWAQTAQVKAKELAGQARSQGEWAVGTISRQVEQNPVTSIVVALGVGFMIGMMTRRLW